MANKFSDLIKESFFDKRKITGIKSIFIDQSTYQGKVANAVESIIMNERGISEKSFSQLDQLKIEIEKTFETSKVLIEDLINNCREKGYRTDYTAEIIYHDFYRQNKEIE